MSATTPLGVLLLQVGTPDDATVPAVRRYLRQFLSDPRIVEAPRFLWWFILNGIVLWRRPKRSATRYQRIWNPKTGMPLLHYTQKQAERLQELLPEDMVVRFAMRYGNPSTAAVVRELLALGIQQWIVLPMYPQYSGTTTGSALDGLFQALMKERHVPALRIVPPYYEHPAYLDAMAELIRDQIARLPHRPDHYLLSFHGIPQSFAKKGDPYALHVERTAQALAKRFGWQRGEWSRTYQSLFGREPWLKPFTERTLTQLAKRGIKRVLVATPGFTADCLETIDEIGREAEEVFKQAGGEELYRCPCLNDYEPWIRAMRTLVLEEAGERFSSRSG